MTPFSHKVTALCFLAVGTGVFVTDPRAQQMRDGAADVPAGAGIISGIVVSDGADPRAIRRAIVRVEANALRGSREVVTSDRGEFRFDRLPAGTYSLQVSKPGWLTSYFGGHRPGHQGYAATPLSLGPNEQLPSITMRMQHGGVIAGRIFDASSRPVTSGILRLFRARTISGELRASPISVPLAGPDDRGAYRLYGLESGNYLLSAISVRFDAAPGPLLSAGRPVTAAPTYFPGTTDMSAATVIRLGPDEAREDVDFTLQTVPAAQVAGRVVMPDGRPAPSAQVQIVSRASALPSSNFLPAPRSPAMTAAVQVDGTFSVASVPPGDYLVMARAADPTATTTAPPMVGMRGNAIAPPAASILWANAEIAVNGADVSAIALSLRPGMTVSGRVLVDSKATASLDVTRVRVMLRSVDAASASALGAVRPASVNDQGSFVLKGVLPGRYRIETVVMTADGLPSTAGTGAEWQPISANVGGDSPDVVDEPFEVRLGEDVNTLAIRMTNQLGEITGTVRNATGQPATDLVVAVYSTDRNRWALGGRRMPAPVQTDRAGVFHVRNLPAGSYFVVGATDVDYGDLDDPSILEALIPQAFRITLAEGERRVMEFKVGVR